MRSIYRYIGLFALLFAIANLAVCGYVFLSGIAAGLTLLYVRGCCSACFWEGVEDGDDIY